MEGVSFGAHKNLAEEAFKTYQQCVEIDRRGDDGNELDELQAHIVLERQAATLTVREMRAVMREVDLDFNKKVCT